MTRFAVVTESIYKMCPEKWSFRTRSGVNAPPRPRISGTRGARPSRFWENRAWEQGRVAGFSLVEILCAVLILGVALTGLVQGVTIGLRSNKESELQTVAALFAAGQVETVRAEGDLHDGTTDGECGEGLELYRWQQTVAPAGIEGLHEVTVTVEDAKSGKTIYELRTLLFELPDDSRTSASSTRRNTGSQRRRSGRR
jgi:prepilin-type N-terminal cleavage/methylation domain-containing protein